jgi:hypothetical protein
MMREFLRFARQGFFPENEKPPEGIRRLFRFFGGVFCSSLAARTSGRLASLETTVITPRPGWQNRQIALSILS